MNFIFAKLYEEYKRKNNSPKYTITLYISTFYFFLSFAILLPIKTLIEKKIFNSKLEYEKSEIMLATFGLYAILLLIVYYVYIKNRHIFKLVDKYKNLRINKILLYLIIIVSPVTLLLLGATLTVFLNGGEILGNEINGLLK